LQFHDNSNAMIRLHMDNNMLLNFNNALQLENQFVSNELNVARHELNVVKHELNVVKHGYAKLVQDNANMHDMLVYMLENNQVVALENLGAAFHILNEKCTEFEDVDGNVVQVKHDIYEQIKSYQNGTVKHMSIELRNTVRAFTNKLLVKDGILPDVLSLACNLRRGEKDLVIDFLVNVIKKLPEQVKRVIQEPTEYLQTTTSEVLESKERNVISDTKFDNMRFSIAPHWQSIGTIKQTRQSYSAKTNESLGLTPTETGYVLSLQQVIKLLIFIARVNETVPTQNVFKFKMALDGRPGSGGQVGLMIVPLNHDLFPTQDPRSVVYIAIWKGKECEEILQDCEDIRLELEELRKNGINVDGIHFTTIFIWVSDWKAWRLTMQMIGIKEFCPYCLLIKVDNIFGARGAKRETKNFFGFGACDTGICNLHAAQRLTEHQIEIIFHSRTSMLTKEMFEQIMHKYIKHFRLVEPQSSKKEKKEVKLKVFY
ncbi:MAG: hypothetical protein ACK4IX_06125, partial [Candidatus Sericytochromatia bacterium]